MTQNISLDHQLLEYWNIKVKCHQGHQLQLYLCVVAEIRMVIAIILMAIHCFQLPHKHIAVNGDLDDF